MSDSLHPNPNTGRLVFVDSLRGFALLGVFWANLLIFAGINYMTDERRESLFGGPLDTLAYLVERFFVESKFLGLFSLLFGVSFWLFLGRARERGAAATSLFYRRILWLLAIGALHGWLLWCFDILRFYALWGLLLPLFAHMRPRRLLGVALTVSVLVPAVVAGVHARFPGPVAGTADYDAMALAAFSGGSYLKVLTTNWRYDWYLTNSIAQFAYQAGVFGRLLLGLYVARTLDLGNLHAHRTLLRRVLVTGGLAGLLGNTVFAGNLLAGGNGDPLLAFLRRLLVEGGYLGLTLAYAAALASGFLVARWSRAIRALAPLGQMALTWYLLQTAFGIWMFYGFARGPALMGQVGPALIIAVCLAGFAAQVGLARAWMRRFRFGPAEWCWRCLTYMKLQPFRRSSSGDGQQQHAADRAARCG
jgi:uncharacterized protein